MGANPFSEEALKQSFLDRLMQLRKERLELVHRFEAKKLASLRQRLA